MGLLQQVQTGKAQRPPRIMVYGTEGIGKSTLAACAPKPIFIQTEDGLGEINCHKFPLAMSFDEVETALGELQGEKHDYQTVVIDSLDWLERLIFDALCKAHGVQTIEKVDGGYSKGYVHALGYWRRIIDRLMALRDDRDMMIMLLAHAKVEKFEDPEAPAYDRYSPRLHKHSAGLMTEWADAVLFATRRILLKSEESGFNRTRNMAAGLGHDGGERILRCVGGPACIAKNRYHLPAEIPLAWDALLAGITNTHSQNS